MSLCRSYLFVPGNRPERFDKACAAGADAVIVDFEDAVPPADKPAARAALAAWLPADKPVYLRINAADTEWFREDVEACRRPGVAGVLLPKAEDGADVQFVVERAGRPLAILPIIESARGFANAAALATAPGVQRLAFGSLDFQVDLGIEGDGQELLYFRSQLVLASRLAGLQPPVDGVTTAIDDAQRLQDETLRARRLGFGGKLCIHPKQVATVNACFRPSAEEVAWAKRVLDAVAASKGAAVAVDGKMVDRPVILLAERIVRESQ